MESRKSDKLYKERRRYIVKRIDWLIMVDTTMIGASMFMDSIVRLGVLAIKTERGGELVRMVVGLMAMSLGNPKLREKLWKRLTIGCDINSKGRVTLVRNQLETCPVSYSAVMHFIGTHDCGVKELKAINEVASLTDSYSAYGSIKSAIKPPSMYSVAQESRFNLTSDIYASYKSVGMVSLGKETDIDTLILASNTLSPKDITEFIRKCEIALEIYLKNTISTQSIIDISWNANKSPYSASVELPFIVTVSPWSSCVSFNNRFFENKAEIIELVDTFCAKKTWYEKIGIPHSLGILLWGAPGCGKTSFIKALANHASFRGKHIINIRLSKNFDLDVLGRILASAYISHDIFVPLDKRILVFEDIDCMSDVVMDRASSAASLIPAITKIAIPARNDLHINNNSLNTLLNILDGLNEASDRIIIMTSNHPENLDKALTRSGRIDINMEFKKASRKEIEEIVCHFWESESPLPFIIPEDWSRALSAADVVNVCRSCKHIDDVCAAMAARIEADRERERLEKEAKEAVAEEQRDKEQQVNMKAAMTSAAATAATIEILKAIPQKSESFSESDSKRDARYSEIDRIREDTDKKMDDFIKGLLPVNIDYHNPPSYVLI